MREKDVMTVRLRLHLLYFCKVSEWKLGSRYEKRSPYSVAQSGVIVMPSQIISDND